MLWQRTNLDMQQDVQIFWILCSYSIVQPIALSAKVKLTRKYSITWEPRVWSWRGIDDSERLTGITGVRWEEILYFENFWIFIFMQCLLLQCFPLKFRFNWKVKQFLWWRKSRKMQKVRLINLWKILWKIFNNFIFVWNFSTAVV